MNKYLNEEVAYKDLQEAAEKALKRSLKPVEERYLYWLTTMDCETIETFLGMFKDMATSGQKNF